MYLLQEDNAKVRIAFAHNPSTQSKEIAATVMDENNEPTFSDLLYNVIYTQNTDISELKYLFMQAIASLNDKKVSTDGTAKMITPGSPIIELIATENGKKWAELAKKFEKDGVSQPFSGIVINGRVRIYTHIKKNLITNSFFHRLLVLYLRIYYLPKITLIAFINLNIPVESVLLKKQFLNQNMNSVKKLINPTSCPKSLPLSKRINRMSPEVSLKTENL